MIQRMCSDKWQICMPILTMKQAIIIAIIILIIFIIFGWIKFKDRRDNNGSNIKGG
jgi:hypothetical protein